MNKIYYVLYIVKTLYHLLHVALPKKGFYCISRSNHVPAATQPRLFHHHAGVLETISFRCEHIDGLFGKESRYRQMTLTDKIMKVENTQPSGQSP